MGFKEVFEFLREKEAGNELISFLEQYKSDSNQTEADLRAAKSKLEQFDGKDTAAMIAAIEWIDKNVENGVKGLESLKHKESCRIIPSIENFESKTCVSISNTF